MTKEQFRDEILALLSVANINQLDAQLILEEIADQQRKEYEDRETA